MHDAAPAPAVSADTPSPKGLKIAGLAAAVLAIGTVSVGTLARSHDVAAAASWSTTNAIPTVHLIPVKGGAATDMLDLPATLEAWEAAGCSPVSAAMCAAGRRISAPMSRPDRPWA